MQHLHTANQPPGAALQLLPSPHELLPHPGLQPLPCHTHTLWLHTPLPALPPHLLERLLGALRSAVDVGGEVVGLQQARALQQWGGWTEGAGDGRVAERQDSRVRAARVLRLTA